MGGFGTLWQGAPGGAIPLTLKEPSGACRTPSGIDPHPSAQLGDRKVVQVQFECAVA